MVDWCEKVAGLEPVHRSPGEGAWRADDEANHHIALLALPGLKALVDKGHTAGLHHTAFECADPEGNGVEVQVDNFGSWARSKEWMWASADLDKDPIGASFDPEALVAARRDGLDHAEIHRRCRAGEYVPDVVPEVHLPEPW